MSWEGRLEEFVGLPVRDFDPAQADLSGCVLRVGGDLAALLAMPRLDELSGLVLTAPPVDEVVASTGRLVGLRGLGLEQAEGNEEAWFGPDEVMTLLGAFPWLDAFAVGAPRPRLGRLRHSGLRQLIVRATTMPGQTLLELFTSELPGLRLLDLGTPDLGCADAGHGAERPVQLTGVPGLERHTPGEPAGGGPASCCGRSSAMSNHGAFEPTKM